jgi:glycosyltransferase involved in cell wall biosynthesis
MILIFIVISVLYTLFIFLTIYGFYKKKKHVVEKFNCDKISVIIAMRNESLRISKLLKSISNQISRGVDVEIIICDDHSTDQSLDEVLRFKEMHPDIHIISCSVPDGKYGKKAALEVAISRSTGDILLFTDADCFWPERYMQRILDEFENKGSYMVCGSVKNFPSNTVLHSFIQLETSAYQYVNLGLTGLGYPIMANGAALAIRTDIYNSLGSDVMGKKSGSGDDVFLLHTVVRKYGGKMVHALSGNDATVYTKAPDSIRSLLLQRIRWASKSGRYRNPASVLTALTVFITNFLFLISPIVSALNPEKWILICAGIFVVSKVCSDLLLFLAASHDSRNWSEYLLLVMFEFPLAIFITLSAIAGFRGKYIWKGRVYER